MKAAVMHSPRSRVPISMQCPLLSLVQRPPHLVDTEQADIWQLWGLIPRSAANVREVLVTSSRLPHQQDGVPVRQPVAPSSARVSRALHPLLGRWVKSESLATSEGTLARGSHLQEPAPCSWTGRYRRAVLQWHPGKNKNETKQKIKQTQQQTKPNQTKTNNKTTTKTLCYKQTKNNQPNKTLPPPPTPPKNPGNTPSSCSRKSSSAV